MGHEARKIESLMSQGTRSPWNCFADVPYHLRALMDTTSAHCDAVLNYVDNERFTLSNFASVVGCRTFWSFYLQKLHVTTVTVACLRYFFFKRKHWVSFLFVGHHRCSKWAFRSVGIFRKTKQRYTIRKMESNINWYNIC
jgi:hypothetical protein